MFNQKENGLLQDLKSAEQLCIEKYGKYAAQAQTEPLKQLFSSIQGQEQRHLQTLDQIIASGGACCGQQQSGGQGGQQSSGGQGGQQLQGNYGSRDDAFRNDRFLCSDALAMEKHVSADYNISIFEFKDPAVRSTLNHIQKEEQQHGQQIYDYMSANGMYN
ncbi:MAG: spore coat protein [Bacillota bacterium]|nr:spore coat protein [Bacillota bacterium]